jgi:hypothetical protein
MIKNDTFLRLILINKIFGPNKSKWSYYSGVLVDTISLILKLDLTCLPCMHAS